MATTAQLLDADSFLSRPMGPREELIDGRIIVHESTRFHQLVVMHIVVALRRWIDEGGFGDVSLPIDLRISERTVLAPDALWYADARQVDLYGAAQLEPPDLVVEVRSPATWAYDVGLKRERYEGWGVGELWLVDTKSRSVLVHRRSQPRVGGFDVALEAEEASTLRSPLLPGFELAVSALFALPGEHQK